MLEIYTASVFRRHDTGFDHPERAQRLDAALEGARRAGLEGGIVRDPEAHADVDRIIDKVHSADYERDLEHAARSGSRYFHSLDNPISFGTFAAARAAVALSCPRMAPSRNAHATRGCCGN